METLLLHTQRRWHQTYIRSHTCYDQLLLAGCANSVRELFRLPRIDDAGSFSALGIGVGSFFLDHVEEKTLDVGLPGMESSQQFWSTMDIGQG